MEQRLLDLIREALVKQLSIKTNWGRNQIMTSYDQSVSSAILTYFKEIQTHSNETKV